MNRNLLQVRPISPTDLPQVLEIYNQGIIDRIATLEEDPKDLEFMEKWLADRGERHPVLIASSHDKIVGWASINRYSHRCAYNGVGDLSIYIERASRGRGVGTQLLEAIHQEGARLGYHKLLLFTFPFNKLGQGLYRKMGYREVGIFREQGRIDGRFVDVMAMEKILST